VHLHEVHIHEEGLVTFGVLLDVIDGVVRLARVEFRQIVPGNLRDLLGGLPGNAFPLKHVDDLEVFLENCLL